MGHLPACEVVLWENVMFVSASVIGSRSRQMTPRLFLNR